MLIYHAIVLAVLVLLLLNVLANFATFDSLEPATPPTGNLPLISILVPARNEALNITPCVESLLRQNYPHCELLILDDDSEDGTGDLVQKAIAASDGRIPARLLRGKPLPGGWSGKNWACEQLQREAKGSYLFFTDADTVHAPGTVCAALAYAHRKQASLVSAWPRLLTGSLGEHLIVPVILLVGLAFCPLWLQRWMQARNRPLGPRLARALGAANGQFLFFQREAYDAIGGNAALRAHVVEDVALGRAVAARIGHGMKLYNCDSLDFSNVRMYRDFRGTWEGFSKNMRAVFEDRRIAFWVFGAIQWMCLFAPFVWAAIMLTVPSLSAGWHLVAAQIGIIYAIRLLLAARFRNSWLGAILHPLGIFLIMTIGINSWRLARGRGVQWKGRTYKPEI